MGIDDNFHICESCEVQAGEHNHRLEQFTKYGVDELLCRDCREKIERENCKVCPECKEDITQQNQLMQYQMVTKNFSKGEDFRHCKKCQMKRVEKISNRLQRIDFVISNWRTWLATGLGIIGLGLGYLYYLASLK